jgi:hypothetical protein
MKWADIFCGGKRPMKIRKPSNGRQCLVAGGMLMGLLCGSAVGQGGSIQIPAKTLLSIQLLQHVPMKVGESLEGRLLYPVYVDNQIAIPAGATLRGTVLQLDSDRSRRIHARLRGDFTPFHVPVVRFDSLLLPDGSLASVVSDSARDGAPILRLSPAPGAKKGSLVSREIAAEKQRVKDAVAQFTAPGRGDRLVQLIYSQLPYHPERIETGTAWVVDFAQPLNLRLANPRPEAHEKADPPEASAATEWRLRAYLQETISSANGKPGDTFQAVVSEPVFNAGHEVVVPQGSVLVGEVTQTKRARSFGRQGKLRFRFRQLKLPTGFTQPVEGTLAGVDANKAANLQIDTEGGIAPRPQSRLLLPLVLTLLAGRGLDDDGNRVLNGAIASNGLGIIGRIVGIAASSRNVAAGIGFYGAALSFYDLCLARGHNVVFTKNTRIEVTTRPARSTMDTPSPSQ